ncbi:hypothetical protein ACUN9Y_19745 [Halomonas sp. V046]|uniref:hypothetical protein n=1 Tax=Halomonas sp. V046 TaxID=3459611 RepID=UPI004044D728
MLSHLSDRRCKPEGEHLQHLVKPRFTDDEFELIQAEAAMRYDGKLATTVHDATMVGLEVMRERRQALLAKLAGGEVPTDDQHDELIQMLAKMAEQSLMKSFDQRDTA